MIGLAVLILVVVVVAGVGGLYTFVRWYLKSPKFISRRRLSGQTVIITGGTSGIGRETAINLSMRGARLILACRDVKKGHALAGDIRSDTQGEVDVEECDLGSLSSIKRFCAKILETESRVNIVIYCGGVQETPQWKTQEGLDYQMTVNYLSQFLMTFLLLPVIKRSSPGSRIINVSCHSHKSANLDVDNLFSEPVQYNSSYTTALSKLCVLLYSSELGRRLDGSGVTVYCVNPGPCNTDIGRYTKESSGLVVYWFMKLFYWSWLRSPKNGAQTVIYCAVEEKLKDQTGFYYENCSESMPSYQLFAHDSQTLWLNTEAALGIR